MFSAIQFNDVFKKLKTHLGVDAEEGVDDGVGGGEGGDAAFANDAVATPNGVAVDADVNGAVNGTSTGPEENQPRTSAFEATRGYLPRLELKSPSRVVNSIRERLGGSLTNAAGGVTNQSNGEATGATQSGNAPRSDGSANQNSLSGHPANQADDPAKVADEGVSWQRVKDRLTGERVKSLFTPSRFSLSAWGAKQPEPEANGDLNLNDPELHKAAVTIQSAFKFYKHSKKSHEENSQASSLSAAERQEIEEIDLADPALHEAATRIQATFKGHRFRKEAHSQTAHLRAAKAAATMVNNIQDPEEEVDIDLDDPKTAEAATQIQAAFRGMQIRKKKPLAAAVAAKAQAPVSTNPFAPSPAKTAPAKSAPARAPTRPPAARSAPGREPSVPARTGPPPRPPAASRPPNVPSRPPRPGTSYNRRDGY